MRGIPRQGEKAGQDEGPKSEGTSAKLAKRWLERAKISRVNPRTCVGTSSSGIYSCGSVNYHTARKVMGEMSASSAIRSRKRGAPSTALHAPSYSNSSDSLRTCTHQGRQNPADEVDPGGRSPGCGPPDRSLAPIEIRVLYRVPGKKIHCETRP